MVMIPDAGIFVKADEAGNCRVLSGVAGRNWQKDEAGNGGMLSGVAAEYL
ncbi:MAG: hypothetical protein JW947_00685 [Sedimentisphaerales bacterium]|nr:hypothetical protein [Sedimentisphaerales bacterium]